MRESTLSLRPDGSRRDGAMAERHRPLILVSSDATSLPVGGLVGDATGDEQSVVGDVSEADDGTDGRRVRGLTYYSFRVRRVDRVGRHP